MRLTHGERKALEKLKAGGDPKDVLPPMSRAGILERFRCFSILLGFPRRANSASPEPLMMEAKDGTGLQPGFA